MAPIEAEKLENKALDILGAIRHVGPKKKQRRLKRVLKNRKRRLRANGVENSKMAEEEDSEGEDDENGNEMLLRPTDKDGIDIFDDTMSEISPPPSTLTRGGEGASTLSAHHWFLTERSQMPRTYPVSEGSRPLRVPPGSSGSKGVL